MSDSITITRIAVDTDGDTLIIEGLGPDGEAVTAYGWVTAITNFYPPEEYQEDGHRRCIDPSHPKHLEADPYTPCSYTPPRAMDKEERDAYLHGLLREAYASLPGAKNGLLPFDPATVIGAVIAVSSDAVAGVRAARDIAPDGVTL